MHFESQGREFEFYPRGNTGLLIKTIKELFASANNQFIACRDI
jgi:hypothetical protein